MNYSTKLHTKVTLHSKKYPSSKKNSKLGILSSLKSVGGSEKLDESFPKLLFCGNWTWDFLKCFSSHFKDFFSSDERRNISSKSSCHQITLLGIAWPGCLRISTDTGAFVLPSSQNMKSEWKHFLISPFVFFLLFHHLLLYFFCFFPLLIIVIFSCCGF